MSANDPKRTFGPAIGRRLIQRCGDLRLGGMGIFRGGEIEAHKSRWCDVAEAGSHATVSGRSVGEPSESGFKRQRLRGS